MVGFMTYPKRTQSASIRGHYHCHGSLWIVQRFSWWAYRKLMVPTVVSKPTTISQEWVS